MHPAAPTASTVATHVPVIVPGPTQHPRELLLPQTTIQTPLVTNRSCRDIRKPGIRHLR